VTDVRFVDEMPFGFGWIALEPRFTQRCSHALATEGGVWVIDPVNGPGVLERIRELGEPAGVLVLFGRHERDSAEVAEQLGVPRYVVPDVPAGAPFDLVPIARRERALWLPDHSVLVVPEALGTAQFMRAPGERLGLHPLRRLTPPKELGHLEPGHLLVGHGEGLHGAEAAAALRDTLAHGRTRTFPWLWAGLRAHLLKRR
jgi:hypothetical protein